MGILEDIRKFERRNEQNKPGNPLGENKNESNQFDIDKKTIKDQKTKN